MDRFEKQMDDEHRLAREQRSTREYLNYMHNLSLYEMLAAFGGDDDEGNALPLWVLLKEEENIFQVEKIIDKFVDADGTSHYLVKWLGFPDEENTWEAETDLDCRDKINKYEAKLRKYHIAFRKKSEEAKQSAESAATPIRSDQANGIVKIIDKYVEDDGEVFYQVKWIDESGERISWRSEYDLDCSDRIAEYEAEVENNRVSVKMEQESEPSIGSPVASISSPNQYEVYVVDKIIGKQVDDDGLVQYLVKWLDHPEEDATWESAGDLTCHDKIAQFEGQKQEAEKRKRPPEEAESRPAQRRRETDDDENDGDYGRKMYVVGRIIDRMVDKKGSVHYKIKWLDVPDAQRSREIETILSCENRVVIVESGSQ